jgi:preprotein translocase subunit SecG
MSFVLGLMSVIAVVSSILLAFVVLLQEPKGGGLAAALGGSGMEAIGPATGSVNRFTSWLAGIWMATCLLHSIMMGGGPAVGAAPAPKPGDKPGETPANTENGGTPPGEQKPGDQKPGDEK